MYGQKEQRSCPICQKVFEILKSQVTACCSRECGNILISKSNTGRPKMKNNLKNKEKSMEDEIKEQHRVTIFDACNTEDCVL